jgi:hypothetical protein
VRQDYTNKSQLTEERREGIRADLLVHTPIGLHNQTFLLDFTCSAIHVDSNQAYAYKELSHKEYDHHQGGVADHAEKLKNALYSKYEHIDGDPSEDSDKKGMKHIVPIACDSRGGLGDEALQFIRRVYARSSPDGPARQWPSESMRTNLRNKLLDELSCLLARHRALDYIFMGVPDENRDNGFQPSPDSSLAHKKRKGHNKQNKTK